MEAIVKIVFGIFLVAVSLSYLYRPAVVLKVNALAREVLFSDFFLLHYRRRLGMVMFAAAILFLYSGFRNLGQASAQTDASTYDEMSEAYRYFYTRRYDEAIDLTSRILRDHPADPHARFLYKQAQAGKKSRAAPIAASTAPAAGHH